MASNPLRNSTNGERTASRKSSDLFRKWRYITDTATPGIYTVHQQLAAGDRVSRFVIQFEDPDLSRIAPGGAPFVDVVANANGAPPRGTLELWPWFAALALLVLAAEWLVFHRGP